MIAIICLWSIVLVWTNIIVWFKYAFSTRRVAQQKSKLLSSHQVAQLERELGVTLEARIDETDKWIRSTDAVLNPPSEFELELQAEIVQQYAILPSRYDLGNVSEKDYGRLYNRPLVTKEATKAPLATCRYCGAGFGQPHHFSVCAVHPTTYQQPSTRPQVTPEACGGTNRCKRCHKDLGTLHMRWCQITISLLATKHEDDCFMCNHPELP